MPTDSCTQHTTLSHACYSNHREGLPVSRLLLLILIFFVITGGGQSAQAAGVPAPPEIPGTPELKKPAPRYEPPVEQNIVHTAEEHKKSWIDSKPDEVHADWVQLVSGEWLRGSVISLHRKVLEFDSDKLDEQEIKLGDITYLKTAHAYNLRFEDKNSPLGIHTTGRIEMDGKDIHVFNDYENEHYLRKNLISIASGDKTEISHWKSKATLSLNIKRGNTNQNDFAAQINAVRRTTLSRITVKYLGNFSSTESIETANNHRANINYDIFLNQRLFWNAIFAEYFRDPFQNIDTRILAGSGIGYNLIDTDKTEWDIRGGAGIKQTRFSTVEVGSKKLENTVFVAAGSDYSTELNSKVDLIGSYSFNLSSKASGGYTHHALGTIETELTKRLNFDVTFVWDRIQYPTTKSDGTLPYKNDFKLLVGLNFKI